MAEFFVFFKYFYIYFFKRCSSFDVMSLWINRLLRSVLYQKTLNQCQKLSIPPPPPPARVLCVYVCAKQSSHFVSRPFWANSQKNSEKLYSVLSNIYTMSPGLIEGVAGVCVGGAGFM